MIEKILGGGLIDISFVACCVCNCEGKCNNDPGDSEGYRDGYEQQKEEQIMLEFSTDMP